MRLSKVTFSLFLTLLMTPALSWGHSLSGSFPKNFATLKKEISRKDLREIKVGYSLFSKPWVQAPSSTKRRDGLGPHFSAVSCISCHPAFGRGAPPGVLHKSDPALIHKAASPEMLKQFGDQITTRSLPGLDPEATIRELKSPLLKTSPRIAPHLAGLGYLEKIEIPHEQYGRFGWKADKVDLRHQVAAAFSGDMGITSSLFPKENCQDLDCLAFIDGADEEGVEIRDDHLDMVVKLIRNIAPPKPRLEFPKQHPGFKVFKKVNCQSCHRPTHKVEGTQIHPYTDLKLHDMGRKLADNSSLPNASLWRTPPLWGLSSQKLVNGHMRLLHDGRAKGIKEAILLHGGEAKGSRENFQYLTHLEQQDLLNFLSNL
ncbi:MAG: hypothetical protein NXH75_06845 [Halobacteriovoraceae bacterium]|nr:hypothetical protein [Halobacteriovoraceae bacterium]